MLPRIKRKKAHHEKTAAHNVASAIAAFAQNTKTNSLPSDPDKAWKEIEAASKAPPTPKDWAPTGPTAEQREQFEKFLGERSADVAEKAHEFYTRFPDHAKAAEAKAREESFNRQALRYGNKAVAEKAEANLTEEQKVERKLNDVQRRAMEKRPEGNPAVFKELESGLREVMKEFPKSPQPWQLMLMIGNYGDPETQKRVLAEITESKVADEETVARAKGLLKAIGSLGRPLDLAYEAIDGRKVDVQKLKGKVVLVDFWATWCGPCMAALPEVVDVYNKYHDKGFEIVGISLDQSEKALKNVLSRHKMEWPQYFDGKGWGNKFVIEYNISEVPTMWLVDKTGKLRTMQAREDLEKQVQDLLAESVN
jgi:thiol-disulfide isomerase/thioredoxin